MRDGVHVQYGGAEQFWDASPPPSAYEDAGVGREEMSSISVHVDPEDGEVSLNAGYEPDSRLGRGERSLFDELRDEIEQALLRRLQGDEDPGYAAFLARHAAPSP